ncbi:F0F1 ATP synthase subunit A [Actinocorallia longicatena]|uniref:ATP synthase subunit a n=1 Tax=Actinocorallia longicatena TaxID=111803 RepID=A0ABP6QIF1_9ACTN
MIADVVLASGDSCHFESSAHCGFPAPGPEIFVFDTWFSIGPFEVTKPAFLAVVACAVICAFFWAAFSKAKLVPNRIQSVGELGYLFVRDQIARPMVGAKGDKFVPYFLAMFVFIWLLNFMAFIPLAQFPVTSRIAFPALFALVAWVIYMYLTFKNNGLVGGFRNLAVPSGLPWWVYIILTPIELLSNIIIRPFTLTIRLFANMFAGHLLIAVFSVAAWYLVSPTVVGMASSAASFTMAIVMTAFELLIQFLQAFIFTMLVAGYIGQAYEEAH